MNKKKVTIRKRVEDEMLLQYSKENSKLKEKSFGVRSLIVQGQPEQNERHKSIDDLATEQNLADFAVKQVIRLVSPYIAEQWQKEKHNKKKQKSVDKRIQRLEKHVAGLKQENEQLCQAMAYFLAAASNVSIWNHVSATDVEKGFKEFYKQYRKEHKRSLKSMNDYADITQDGYKIGV